MLRFCFLLLVCVGTTFLMAQDPPIFQEEGGIVVFETESAINQPNWTLDTTYGGFTGAGSLRYDGSDNFNNPGRSVMIYRIMINKTGTYRFRWHSRISIGDSNTEHNDTWLRLNDASEFFAQEGSRIIYPKGSGQTPNPEGSGRDNWFKVYQNTRDNEWTWNARTSDRDPHDIYARFDTAGVYTIEVAGRSNGHSINRIVMYHSDVSANVALDLSRPESPLVNPSGLFAVPATRTLTTFPNPTAEQLSISIPSDVPARTRLVGIWDQNGRLVSRRQIPMVGGQRATLAVEDLPPGFYVLKFTVGGETFTGRFVRR